MLVSAVAHSALKTKFHATASLKTAGKIQVLTEAREQNSKELDTFTHVVTSTSVRKQYMHPSLSKKNFRMRKETPKNRYMQEHIRLAIKEEHAFTQHIPFQGVLLIFQLDF